MSHWKLASRALVAFLLACCLNGPKPLFASPPNLRGQLGIHDPSSIIQYNGRYYVFGTGQGIISRSSADLQYWVTGPSVFTGQPAWITNYVVGFTGFFWAPECQYFGGSFHLYYACSLGAAPCAIGLATSPDLATWTDHGMIVYSTNGTPYGSIDPSVFWDASSNLWLTYGSHATGIWMAQLDPTTGFRINTNLYNVANVNDAEASHVITNNGYYYLFYNRGICCAGVNSTYNIQMCRSTNVTGPYTDMNGNPVASSGGSLFAKTTGKFIGPGQIGFINVNGTTYFSYHYYDANVNGAPTMDIEPLSWAPTGWPTFTNDWSAVYRFQADARDDNGQYYGLLTNGASVVTDPQRGGVLNLNGSNQFVTLPIGAANARTFITVFKWNGGPAWQRVLDFNRGTNSGYLFLTPSNSATGKIRFAITSTGISGEKDVDSLASAPVGAWTQVAVTTDGTRAFLYVNGVAQGVVGTTVTGADIAPTNAWFGRSPFSVDPYFNGQISSVRIFGRVLSAAEITAPQISISAPATGLTYQPGDTIPFSGTAGDLTNTPLPASSLTWSVEYHGTNTTNVVLGPLSGVASGTFTIPASGDEASNGFHRFILVAVDSSARATTNCVDVFPGPEPVNWTAYYPFDHGAADANSNFNGALVNGAATGTVLLRGTDLNLSGANQYVSLPAGIGNMRTFGAWVRWGGGNNWQRIFDFGSGTTSYAMFTAIASSGRMRFEITPNGGTEARDLDSPAPLPTGVWTHVAIALDGRQAIMYENGQAVAVDAGVNLLPSDVMGSANYLGRSQFSGDPYFSGSLDSVQISSQTLPVEAISAAAVALTNFPSAYTLVWPAFSNGLALHSAPDAAAGPWTLVSNAPTLVNGINELGFTPTNAQTFFQLRRLP